MDKLKGSGNTFSTSGKGWIPFRLNPKVAKRNAKLYRLKAKGMLPSTDKASLRHAIDAMATPETNLKP
jgi:hypothetical protein